MYSSESCFFSNIYFDGQLRNLLTVFFSVSRDVLAFSRRSYIRQRDFFRFRERERQRVVKSGRVVEKKRVLICGDLLWISISVTSG